MTESLNAFNGRKGTFKNIMVGCVTVVHGLRSSSSDQIFYYAKPCMISIWLIPSVVTSQTNQIRHALLPLTAVDHGVAF